MDVRTTFHVHDANFQLLRAVDSFGHADDMRTMRAVAALPVSIATRVNHDVRSRHQRQCD